jgi:hypothetical protein
MQSLLLLNTRVYDILYLYERTIVKEIAATQFPLAEVQYPGIRPRAAQDYTLTWLSEVWRRTKFDKKLKARSGTCSVYSFLNKDICSCQVFAAGLSILWTIYDCGK